MRLLNEEFIPSTEVYRSVKKVFQEEGAKLNLFDIKKEDKQKEILKSIWRTFTFHEDVEKKPVKLFLTNLYIYDDATFANYVEEALSVGIDPQNIAHIVAYLNLQGYKITEGIYNFKVAEFALYKRFYEKTDIWYMIKDILQKTGLTEASIEELREYKRKEVNNQEMVQPAKDLQKIKAYEEAA